jgi:GrpB-like predicted nucleotidyltransferase (UPF0157 family)
VNIVAYDLQWPIDFLTERDRIAAALGSLAVRIDHNGSTAVPGLAAKPAIDIQVSVRQLHPSTCTRKAWREELRPYMITFAVRRVGLCQNFGLAPSRRHAFLPAGG